MINFAPGYGFERTPSTPRGGKINSAPLEEYLLQPDKKESMKIELPLDFYFSKKHGEQIKKSINKLQEPSDSERRTFFKGKEFTDSVPRGEKPAGLWNDYVPIGTGEVGEEMEIWTYCVRKKF